MKIYYTTSKISEDDWSWYGIFAQDGNDFYELSILGLWQKTTHKPQINYYKTCSKIDLETYINKLDKPQRLQMFYRTKGVPPTYTRENGKACLPFIDNSYVDWHKTNAATAVICPLPDGGLLCLTDKSKVIQSCNKKQCPIFTISPKYTQDGMFVLQDTNTSLVPKDFVEDALANLEETFACGAEIQ
ncbi:MAG: hypothetical protein J6A28_02980 [Clostridia bacterium]|nr:hypothetical protein [Clostridia bacterium]